jgi:hypothetical protein
MKQIVRNILKPENEGEEKAEAIRPVRAAEKQGCAGV